MNKLSFWWYYLLKSTCIKASNWLLCGSAQRNSQHLLFFFSTWFSTMSSNPSQNTHTDASEYIHTHKGESTLQCSGSSRLGGLQQTNIAGQASNKTRTHLFCKTCTCLQSFTRIKVNRDEKNGCMFSLLWVWDTKAKAINTIIFKNACFSSNVLKSNLNPK